MTFAESIRPEFEQEMVNTRRMLTQVPDDKLDWKPHAKSNSIGWNASHLVEIPSWVAGTMADTKWDITGYKTIQYRSRDEILKHFDSNVASATAALKDASDEAMNTPWSLVKDDQTLMTMPRRDVIRIWVINHTIHHRAILSVYLRMNDIPVPGMYGPSGDDPS